MLPASQTGLLQAAVDSIAIHDGVDSPESATEALYQLMTGEGGRWATEVDGAQYVMNRYASDCQDGRWGAACFRLGSLPVVFHFTDYCSHNGPPSDNVAVCTPYTGIRPAPVPWEASVAVMNERAAKYVGINTDLASCVDNLNLDGPFPCHFMRETARATGAVLEDGTAMIYDLPNGGATAVQLVDAVVEALQAVVTRVPLDVGTRLRDEPSDAVDARAFVVGRTPACAAIDPLDPCWVAPPNIAHEDAVASFDNTTFAGVLPRTEVTFRISFANDTRPAESSSQVYVTFLDIVGDSAVVLDTRAVYVVIPSTPGSPII